VSERRISEKVIVDDLQFVFRPQKRISNAVFVVRQIDRCSL